MEIQSAECKKMRAELTRQSSIANELSYSQGPTKTGEKLKQVEHLLDEARHILFDLED